MLRIHSCAKQCCQGRINIKSAKLSMGRRDATAQIGYLQLAGGSVDVRFYQALRQLGEDPAGKNYVVDVGCILCVYRMD